MYIFWLFYILILMLYIIILDFILKEINIVIYINIICVNIGDSKAVLVYEDNNLAQINVDSDKYKIIAVMG